MIYRAKCKKCDFIIETEGDEVFCKCGEISIGGNGNPKRCSADDFKNFVRVDENGNEIVVEFIEKKKPTKEELKETLKDMIKDIEDLPSNAKIVSVNQYDLLTFYYWMLSWVSSDE